MIIIKNKTLASVGEEASKNPSFRDTTLKEKLEILASRTKADLPLNLRGDAVWLGRCLWNNKGVYIADSLLNSDGSFELVKKDIEKISRFVPNKPFEEKLRVLDATAKSIQVSDDAIYTDILSRECAELYLERIKQDMRGTSKGIIVWPGYYSEDTKGPFLGRTFGMSLNYSKGDISIAHCISLVRDPTSYLATAYLKPKEVKEAPKLEEKVAA